MSERVDVCKSVTWETSLSLQNRVCISRDQARNKIFDIFFPIIVAC